MAFDDVVPRRRSMSLVIAPDAAAAGTAAPPGTVSVDALVLGDCCAGVPVVGVPTPLELESVLLPSVPALVDLVMAGVAAASSTGTPYLTFMSRSSVSRRCCMGLRSEGQ